MSRRVVQELSLTVLQAKALRILRDNPDVHPEQFAELMWPDPQGWERYTSAEPDNNTRGSAMTRSGNSYLSALRNAGLVQTHSNTHVLSPPAKPTSSATSRTRKPSA